ncbi:MAG: hypothetical protein V2B19_02415, partial [Pseudomonadota bacterium]
MNLALLTQESLTDYGYAGDERSYTLIAVDRSDIESMGRTITLPKIKASLVEGSRLERGIMNKLEYRVTSAASEAVQNIRIKTLVSGRTHMSEKFSLSPGATETIPVIIGGYNTLQALETITSRIEITPNEGEKIEIVETGQMNVIDGTMYLSILNEEFLRGGNGVVRMVLQNTGEDDIEVVTAEDSGKAASMEVTFYLLDADENVIYTKAFKQSLGDQIVTLPNKKSVARIPAGDTFTSAPLDLHIPGSAPDDVTIKLEVKNIYHHLGQADEVSMKGLSTRHQVNLR